MKVLKNTKIDELPVIEQNADRLNLPYKPPKPFPDGNFVFLIIGAPGSGKTSFWNSLLLARPTKKNKRIPRVYYRYFDKILLFSPSLGTLPNDKLQLNPERMFEKYTDEELIKFIESENDGENLNNLIIIDDSIKQIKNNKVVHGLICNRRHLTYNPNEEHQAGLSVIITSQKFNALDTIVRLNASDIILYPTNNQKEITSIRDELMADLTTSQQDELLKKAWDKPHSFLYIKNYMPTKDRYYVKFDKVVFEDDELKAFPLEEQKMDEKEIKS